MRDRNYSWKRFPWDLRPPEARRLRVAAPRGLAGWDGYAGGVAGAVADHPQLYILAKAGVLPAMEAHDGDLPRRLVFLDEAGSHIAMTRDYGRAPRGQRVLGSVPRNRGEVTTMIGLSASRASAP
jgi:hypothetical protein